MHNLLQLIGKHLDTSGLISTTTIGVGLSTTVAILQIISMCIGIPVGLITLYIFLERKGLLPKWLEIKDKNEGNNSKSNKTDKN
jgi:hypothetical protein